VKVLRGFDRHENSNKEFKKTDNKIFVSGFAVSTCRKLKNTVIGWCSTPDRTVGAYSTVPIPVVDSGDRSAVVMEGDGMRQSFIQATFLRGGHPSKRE